MEVLRALRLPGSIGTAALVLAAGTLSGLDQAGVPKVDWWRTGIQNDVLIGVVSAASVLSFFVVVAYSRLLGGLNDRERLDAMAEGVVSVVGKHATPLRKHVEINIFRVQGPIGFRRLESVARAGPEAPETPILWTKGKGVIGYAWKTKRSKYADLEALQQLLANEDDFCSIPADDRFRFTWEEFDDTRRFKAVLAVPIRPKRAAGYPVKGILAVSALTTSDRELLDGIQHTPEFVTILKTCRAILGRRRES